MGKARNRRYSKRPLITAVTVLAVLLGATLLVLYGPWASKSQDAAVIGLNFRQSSSSTKPYLIDIVVQNHGESESKVRVEVSITPADLDGTTRIGPSEGILLAPEEVRGISMAFNPDPGKNYTITASAFADGGPDTDLTNNEQQLAFPVYHHRARLIVEIYEPNSTVPMSVNIPSKIGLAGGVWANHTLDSWGFPGFRAAMYTEPPSSDPGSTVYDGYVNIRPTRLGRDFAVGDFFGLWGAGLTDSCIRLPDIIDSCSPGGPSGVLAMEITPEGSSPRQIQEDYRGQVFEDGMEVWFGFFKN